eukprot:12186668-Prorocentrum_lima.AAC.1
MTSSLVGSEMCIRDRSFQELQPQAGKSKGHGFLVEHHTFFGQREQQTVSYTHLTLPTICSV